MHNEYRLRGRFLVRVLFCVRVFLYEFLFACFRACFLVRVLVFFLACFLFFFYKFPALFRALNLNQCRENNNFYTSILFNLLLICVASIINFSNLDNILLFHSAYSHLVHHVDRDPQPGFRIRIRSDPVFLHGSGSGSGFQISLDPDPDPVFKFSGSGPGSGFSQDSGKLQKGL